MNGRVSPGLTVRRWVRSGDWRSSRAARFFSSIEPLNLTRDHGADRLAVGVEQLVGDADLDRPALEDQVPPDELEVVRLVRVLPWYSVRSWRKCVDVVEDAVRLRLAVDQAGVVEQEVEGQLLGQRVLELDLRAAGALPLAVGRLDLVLRACRSRG